jgi:hypothetical protein
MYESLEITLPVSPQQLLLFIRGAPGLDYHAVPEILVDHINRRTRALGDQHFVVCREVVKPFWLDTGKIPDDAWDVVHASDAVEDEANDK